MLGRARLKFVKEEGSATKGGSWNDDDDDDDA